MLDDYLLFGLKYYAGLRTYAFNHETGVYDSRSQLSCRTTSTSMVSLIKKDIYDETTAYFVIKSNICKITVQDIEKPRVLKSYEHFSHDTVYAGHGTEFAVIDFKQVGERNMVVLSSRWIRVIEMYSQKRLFSFNDLPEPQSYIVLSPDFDL